MGLETKSFIMETDKNKRKQIPIFTGLIKYFPKALAEVAKVSYIGNQQHHPDKPLHWDRSKSTDELDALTRHLFQAGETDTDGMLHSAKVAWRALANLEKELEKKDDKWYVDQYNRNRDPKDRINLRDEINRENKEIL
tara:strand:- start:127 stop:540 length:414 start_codon:yes stop_codon:yes gene_type:complete